MVANGKQRSGGWHPHPALSPRERVQMRGLSFLRFGQFHHPVDGGQVFVL